MRLRSLGVLGDDDWRGTEHAPPDGPDRRDKGEHRPSHPHQSSLWAPVRLCWPSTQRQTITHERGSTRPLVSLSMLSWLVGFLFLAVDDAARIFVTQPTESSATIFPPFLTSKPITDTRIVFHS